MNKKKKLKICKYSYNDVSNIVLLQKVFVSYVAICVFA